MSDKEKIVLIAGGGHCKACIDVIEAEDKYSVSGIVDVLEKVNQAVGDYFIIGTDEDIARFAEKYKNFLITIGSVKDPSKRIRMFNQIKESGGCLATIISPTAYVAKTAKIGEGSIIMHKAFVNSDARVGHNCIVNTSVLIEHCSVIGDHCHLAPGCVINGAVHLGSGCFIGSNAVIANNVTVANNVVIGAGAVVVKDIKESGVYVGNPAKRVEEKVLA